MISGQKTWLWLREHWPMDGVATAFFASLLFVVWVWYGFLRKRPVKAILASFLIGFLERTLYWVRTFVLLPWRIFQGLFFTKDQEGEASFNAFKALFVVMSFVIISRVFVGGKTVEGLQAGPQVVYLSEAESKPVNAIPPSPSKRKGASSPAKQSLFQKIKKSRAWLVVQKWSNEPITLYELLAWLIACMLFYYRHDLSEGEKGNGFESLLSTLSQAYLYRTTGKLPDADPVSAIQVQEKSTTTTTAITTNTTSAEQGNQRLSVPKWTEDNDPFLK